MNEALYLVDRFLSLMYLRVLGHNPPRQNSPVNLHTFWCSNKKSTNFGGLSEGFWGICPRGFCRRFLCDAFTLIVNRYIEICCIVVQLILLEPQTQILVPIM